ncbi:MAG TPA: MgtC/SapB family protein [candidate division Zixibacteria bacterium]|nr:MgtC/SapB family protein [candidate division Zixibacteria bacterium]
MFENIFQDLNAGLPDGERAVILLGRLIFAMVLGAIVGLQRERKGKPAGLRTHMLVALGAALFVIAPAEYGMGNEELSRVVQGLVTGIGFLGAGAILKLEEKREVEGLTTAAGIWMIAAVGVAVGLGRVGLAVVSTLLTWVTLAWIGRMENYINRESQSEPEERAE